jgi:hypothetical protein
MDSNLVLVNCVVISAKGFVVMRGTVPDAQGGSASLYAAALVLAS